MECLISLFIFIIAFALGYSLACVLSISKEPVSTKEFETMLEQERADAIKENKSIDYINGMSRLVGLYRNYFWEETK